MKSYFFDLDGTLTDSRDGLIYCMRAALKQLGFPEQEAKNLNRFLGTALPEIFREFKVDVTNDEIHAGMTAFRNAYEIRGIKFNKLYPDVLLMLKSIKQNNQVACIVTSKPEKYALQVVKLLKIDHLLDACVGPSLSEDEDKEQLINRALKITSSDKNKTLMLGDRHYDIIGASKAGVKSVGALWGYGTKQELQDAGCIHFASSVKDFTKKNISKSHSRQLPKQKIAV